MDSTSLKLDEPIFNVHVCANTFFGAHYCMILVMSQSNLLTFTIILTRLHDLHHLQILYPNKRKDEVFGKYYAPPRKSFCSVYGWM